MPEHSNDLTDEQKAFLKTDAFVNSVLRARTSTNESTPLWLAFFRSTGGAALVTVIIGGIATAIITGMFQGWQKDRDLENGIIALYSQFLIDQHKDTLAARASLRHESFTLLGQIRNSAGSMIDIEGPAFAFPDDPQQREKIMAQKEQVRTDFNRAWERWQTHKTALGSRFDYHYGDESRDAWKSLGIAVDELLQCIASPTRQGEEAECSRTVNEIEEQLNLFEESLRQSIPRFPSMDKSIVEDIRGVLSKE